MVMILLLQIMEHVQCMSRPCPGAKSEAQCALGATASTHVAMHACNLDKHVNNQVTCNA
jgi:hypothetical protein